MTSFGTEHQEFESNSNSYRFEEECWNQTRQTPFTPRHHKAQGNVRTPPIYDVLSFVYAPLLSSVLSFAYISFLRGRSPRIYFLFQVPVYSITSYFHCSYYLQLLTFSRFILLLLQLIFGGYSSVISGTQISAAQLKTDSDLE